MGAVRTSTSLARRPGPVGAARSTRTARPGGQARTPVRDQRTSRLASVDGLAWAVLLVASSQMSVDRMWEVYAVAPQRAALVLNALQVGAGLVIVARGGRRPVSWSLLPSLLIAVVALCSTAWSVLPARTMVYALALAATVVVCTRLPGSVRDVARWSVLGLLVPLLVSLAHPRRNEWSAYVGLFDTRNELARHAVYAVAVGVVLLAASRTRGDRAVAWSGIGVGAAMVATSGSATATVALAAVVAVPAARRLGAMATAPVRVVLGAFALAGLAGLSPWLVTGVPRLLGRSADLTGRTDIWAHALVAVADRPLLGYGPRAFWPSGHGDAIRESIGPQAVHAHNAWIDVVLSYGVIGAAVVVCLLAWQLVRVRVRGTDDLAWRTAFAVVVVVVGFYSLTESAMLRPLFAGTLITLAFLGRQARGR